MGRRPKQTMTVTEETGVSTKTVPFAEDGAAMDSMAVEAVLRPNNPRDAVDGHGRAGTGMDDSAIRNLQSAIDKPAAAMQVEMWPEADLVGYPDNPRTVNTESPKFRDLVDSIRANGIREPLTVRELPGGLLRQILRGHRRLAAAREIGLKTVPVIDLGVLSDEEAYRNVAIGNEHEPLTPLEEGKRIALALDKYAMDVKAVATMVGKPERWVVEHAQIWRGLSAEWKEFAAKDKAVVNWTAGHWIVIARLPLGLQAACYKKLHGVWYGLDRWTIKELEEKVKIDLLYLSKAPFGTGEGTKCHACLSRSGRQPLLFADNAQDAVGDKERCLEPKCYASRSASAVKADFKAKAAEALEQIKNQTSNIKDQEPVPISMVEEPKGDSWSHPREWDRYKASMRPVRKAFGQGLVTADRVTVVSEGTKGAVPGIVVAGKGKGSLKWVKVAKKEERSSGGGYHESPAAIAKRKKEEEEKGERWSRVSKAVFAEICKVPRPSDTAVILCCLSMGSWPEFESYGNAKLKKKTESLWGAVLKAHRAADMVTATTLVLDECWERLQMDFAEKSQHCWRDGQVENLKRIAPLFGIDLNQRYNELAAKEEKKSESSDLKSQKKGKKKSKSKKQTSNIRLKCRVCGCTDDDCHQCIEKTGKPCHWVEDDLCSACEAEAAKKKDDKDSTVNKHGVITDPDIVPAELPADWKATATVTLGCVKGKWYFGLDLQVTSAGHGRPCSTKGQAYGSRDEALRAGELEAAAWFESNPARDGYKHYGAIGLILRNAAEPECISDCDFLRRGRGRGGGRRMSRPGSAGTAGTATPMSRAGGSAGLSRRASSGRRSCRRR